MSAGTCERCGYVMTTDVSLCRLQWLQVNPQDVGILCANCMATLARAGGHALTVHMVFATSEDYDRMNGCFYPSLSSECPQAKRGEGRGICGCHEHAACPTPSQGDSEGPR